MSLELKNVIKQYPEFTMELSFRVETGELLTLLGPSGCGKTTTLHLIAGFIMPDSGSIEIDGIDITAIPPHFRRVGVVFQDYALFPNMNVYNNIAFGLRMHDWERAAIRKRVKELLELVKLEGFEKRTVTQLSGGEQQRVALARALATNPRLLLLDEPLSALDANLRKELRAEIKRIQRELNITTVYVTHDQEEALALSDRIALMHDGRIEQTGTPSDIYNCPETLFVANFMGMTNRIGGIVKQKIENRVELDTPEGKFYATLRDKINTGSSATLLFRPEHCRITQIEKATEIKALQKPVANSISGTITSCEYLGEKTLIQIETENGRYGALLPCGSHPELTPRGSNPEQKKLRIGNRVTIKVDPEDCWILLSR